MSYIRTKNINGNTYYYLVKGVREGKKVRQKVIKYLGKQPPSPLGKERFTDQHTISIDHFSILFAAELRKNGFTKSKRTGNWIKPTNNMQTYMIIPRKNQVVIFNHLTKKLSEAKVSINGNLIDTKLLRNVLGSSIAHKPSKIPALYVNQLLGITAHDNHGQKGSEVKIQEVKANPPKSPSG